MRPPKSIQPPSVTSAAKAGTEDKRLYRSAEALRHPKARAKSRLRAGKVRTLLNLRESETRRKLLEAPVGVSSPLASC